MKILILFNKNINKYNDETYQFTNASALTQRLVITDSPAI